YGRPVRLRGSPTLSLWYRWQTGSWKHMASSVPTSCPMRLFAVSSAIPESEYAAPFCSYACAVRSLLDRPSSVRQHDQLRNRISSGPYDGVLLKCDSQLF